MPIVWCASKFMKRIIFWRTIVGDKRIFSPYQKQLGQLNRGEYKALSLEELQQSGDLPIYSIRVNRKRKRILFTSFEGKLVLLDVVVSHDYHKSRFLKHPRILAAFLKKKLPPKLTDAEEISLTGEFTPCEEVKGVLPEQDEGEVDLVPFEYQQQKMIYFDDDQEKARSLQFPAIIYGPAGSGKTSVALSLLQGLVQRAKENDDTAPILYVSQSEPLIRSMQSDWQALVPEAENQSRVQFLTLKELAQAQGIVERQIKGIDEFSDWYSKRKKRKFEAKTIWLEFRIISGYSTLEEYQLLGQKQSCSFVPESQRENLRAEIFALYVEYAQHLKNNNWVSLELNFPVPKDLYSAVLLDEAQDCSYGQLKRLQEFASDRQIGYFLGDHQILFDGKSRAPYIRSVFRQQRRQLSEQLLSFTYRCSRLVTEAANQLIQLKYHLVGGAADKDECNTIHLPKNSNTGEGSLEWKNTTDDLTHLINQGVSLAVITHPDFVEEAKIKFATTLVFTPSQIKGLEYDRVVVWKPCQTSLAFEANKHLKARPFVPPSGNRAKHGRSHEEFLPFFDELITAVTRARRELIWVDDDVHQIEQLRDFLAPTFKQSTASSSTASTSTSSTSTTAPAPAGNSKEDWLEEAKRQRLLGNIQHAEAIEARFNPSVGQSTQTFFAQERVKKTNHQRAKAPKPEKIAPPPIPAPPKTAPPVKAVPAVVTPSFTEEKMITLLDNFIKSQGKIESLFALINKSAETSQMFLRCLVNHTRFLRHLSLADLRLQPGMNKQLQDGLALIPQEFIEEVRTINPQDIELRFPSMADPPTIVALAFNRNRLVENFYHLWANLNSVNNHGRSLAHYAVHYEDKWLLGFLNRYHILLDQRDNFGVTPAYIALENRSDEMLELLKVYGANLTDLLRYAIRDGEVDYLERLERLGVDLYKNNQGPFIAAELGALGCLSHLVERNPECLNVPTLITQKALIDFSLSTFGKERAAGNSSDTIIHRVQRKVAERRKKGDSKDNIQLRVADIAEIMKHEHILEYIRVFQNDTKVVSALLESDFAEETVAALPDLTAASSPSL